MEDALSNRQDAPRRRKQGRPTLAEVAARAAPEPPKVAPIPNPNPGLPPIYGFVCPMCGRAQNPRIIRTVGLVRIASCELCGCRLKMTYTENATAVTSIQVI